MSSGNSKQQEKSVGMIPPELRRRLENLRHRGHAGSLIPMHRGLLVIPARPRELLIAVTLIIVLTGGWLSILDWVTGAWHTLLEWWVTFLQLDAVVALHTYNVGSWLDISVPHMEIGAGLPSCLLWSATIIITALLFKIPVGNIPFRYLIKAAAFIQLCALIFFLMYPDGFPHQLSDYHVGMMAAGLVLITLIPVLFGFTYYIFDFSLQQKLAITVITMLYLGLFIPFQYLLHAWLIHHASLLFLPILFFLFGLPLDILAVIALYAWGMSWKTKLHDAEAELVTSPASTVSVNNQKKQDV